MSEKDWRHDFGSLLLELPRLDKVDWIPEKVARFDKIGTAFDAEHVYILYLTHNTDVHVLYTVIYLYHCMESSCLNLAELA